MLVNLHAEAESTKESVAEKFRILEDQYGKLQNENER